jgi:polysaccharide biosynthesis transport protein
MEFAKFIHLLRKHKYGLIGIPILVMGITFFLVRKLPNVYSSQSRLSAGLTAGSGTMELAQQLLNSQGLSESKVSQTFSNVTQTMQLKIVFDQVSYQLILHDLKDPEHALRKPSKLLNDLTPDARKHAIEVYTKLYNNRQALYLTDLDQQVEKTINCVMLMNFLNFLFLNLDCILLYSA